MNKNIVYVQKKEELDKIVAEKGKVLVDFFAEWCGPCKMLAPALEAVADETVGTAAVIKVDIDRAEELATEYRIQAVPTLVYFNGGEVVKKVTGLQSKAQMMQEIEKL